MFIQEQTLSLNLYKIYENKMRSSLYSSIRLIAAVIAI